MLLKLRYELDSNPTLSAMLLKINKLIELSKIPEPTLKVCFVFWNEQHAVLQGPGAIR